ncbi:MAG: tRNA pseudouridine(55) synthase TruB [Alphaproteobacteria bacterium]|nr:tRNA pseudouridine(55) synthase TruB [Alphaproteobacteria bacterium]
MIPQKPKPAVHGWIVLDKPHGLTSTQALGKVRRLLGGKKAGHGGTLDPLATGILPLAFGEATKLIPYVIGGDKEYEFTVRWGEQRSTDDTEGEVTAASSVRPNEEAIRQALPQFTGLISQTPPVFSAIKLDGERAYDIARAGGQPELAPRQVMIHKLELTGMPDADHAAFRVSCGKGMYVRALARDLARILGTYGHVSQLRRTRVGPFTLEKAISLEKLEELKHKEAALTALLALGAALDDIPGLHLTAGEAQCLRNGQSLLIRPQHMHLMQAPLILAGHQGVPVALVEPKAGAFHVVRGFHF